ncbi:MAG: von Willebrand factor type A domain-containing protein [Planctomycetaceae bacterium]|jgi:Ca-activated chloride channel family protein|nr:von Willebrand factor type A domain-containing protein [Planctomycetaceae bacterium]
MKISLSDPRLTSLVTDELSEAEMKEIQALVDADPELQKEVETIQKTIEKIKIAMQNEPLPDNKSKKNIAVSKRKNWFVRITVAVAATVLIAVGIIVWLQSQGDLILRHQNLDIGIKSGIHNAERPNSSSNRPNNDTAKQNFVESSPSHLPAPESSPHGLSVPSPRAANVEIPTNKMKSDRSEMLLGQRRIVNKDMEVSDNKQLLENRFGDQELSDPYNSANAETYKNTIENDFKSVKVGEFSTFSIDVDTASYSAMRRFVVEMGKRPPVDSVRVEEYINYFKYDYAQPTDKKPFAVHVDVSPCAWQPKHLLARIGIKGKEYSASERPALNLVFLIDVSGSMSSSNRLPLIKRSLTELVEMLQARDRVAIVTYAGSSRVALPSVSGQEKRAILDSINSLGAGGSTAGAAGIKTAYEVARKYYDKNAQNRVILCTDGDFNVGETNNKTLEDMIGEEAKSGVFLTVLGFGMGNYKDERLKILSMRGNGNYGYIDTPEESRRLLVEGLTGTLFAIAKDVKIQVDFNPAKVAGYRLIGYENRKLRDEDFHNDQIDAGEIGAGHTVTALYEIVPVGVSVPLAVDKSRYDNSATEQNKNVAEDNKNADNKKNDGDANKTNELIFVKLRYKLPDADKSSLLEYPVLAVSKDMPADSQFASAVALFAMLLRESKHSGDGTFDSVIELAKPNIKDDKYRKEFVELVEKVKNYKK